MATPLQHPCLENPVDGGAWRAAVRGVAQSHMSLSKHAHRGGCEGQFILCVGGDG